ncbi:hypothetical protein HJC23_008486 [Cyclotella cryptica]|uniref:Guanine nucleotide-binding protein subunit beta-like protein n=1 Tax=Cyclotella cryptica TaxID=29204 RepID=A0ABD3QZY9_9STRA|eukprot:CCRYP_001234-RA/>CCRYP_001234-RA protein AED:0.04 eAED:0.04 QI:119/1/1/1/1/1/3/117/532
MASNTTFSPPKLQKRKLKGHQKAVLCLAHSAERLAYCPARKSTKEAKELSDSSDAPITTAHPSLLLSGSEDGTARLWDLRVRKTAYCMVVPRTEEGETLEVTSVAFHPSVADASDDNRGKNDTEQTTKSVLEGARDRTVYLSASNHVYGYDLRYHASPSSTRNASSSEISAKPATCPIIRSPHFDLTNSFQCTDEINQLSFSFQKHNDSNNEYHLAAASDSGDVHICKDLPFNYSRQQVQTVSSHRILHHADKVSQAITSCSLFRPRVNELQLASCGTDCTVKLWDVKKPRRPMYTVNIKPQTDNQNSTQLCNPPFVHSLSWSPSGRLLLAGLGDGSCVVYRVEGRRLVEVGRLGWDYGGHSSAVAAVLFPCFGLCRNSSYASHKALLNGTADDRLIISAGNDGKILFWDLGRDLVGCDAGCGDPSLYLSRDPNKDAAFSMCEHSARDLTSKCESVSLPLKSNDQTDVQNAHHNGDEIPSDLLPSPPRVLFQIPHHSKTNWICSKPADATLPCSFFVADTTCDISLYVMHPL